MSKNIVLPKTIDPKKEQEILAVAEYLVSCGAKKVILFGSQATGKWKSDSDIDIIAIDCENKAMATAARGKLIRKIRTSLDIYLVSSGEDRSDIIKEAIANGTVIFKG
jgi:predicted nucleotidyltransferase